MDLSRSSVVGSKMEQQAEAVFAEYRGHLLEKDLMLILEGIEIRYRKRYSRN